MTMQGCPIWQHYIFGQRCQIAYKFRWIWTTLYASILEQGFSISNISLSLAFRANLLCISANHAIYRVYFSQIANTSRPLIVLVHSTLCMRDYCFGMPINWARELMKFELRGFLIQANNSMNAATMSGDSAGARGAPEPAAMEHPLRQ